MKKTIIVIILVVLFVFNIIVAAFILNDVQMIKFPKTTIRVDVVEVNSNEILIHHDLQIYNPNSFEMILQNIQIVTTTPSGDEVARILIDGGSIPGQSNQNYSSNDRIIMKGNLSGLLTSTVTGTVGINFLGIIKKTVPLEVTVLTSLKDALSKIAVPTITARTEFGNITRQAIDLSAEIDITNPNTVDLFIGDISLNVTTEIGKPIGNFTIPGSQIPAGQSLTLQGSGTILLEALNAKTLHMVLATEAGATIAGINKTLPVSTTIDIGIPDFRQFIPSDPPLELSINIDLQKAKGGLKGNMILEVINPTKIPLVARNLVIDYYRVVKNQKTLIAVGTLGSGELVPENITYFYGTLFLSYAKLFNLSSGDFFPDMVFAQLRADISLSGVNISLPVAIGSYIDLHFFRPTE
jgi:LEA14-like dessication related protein